jgi:hypothetical protein
MKFTTAEEMIAIALDGVLNNRLVLIAGAGLSMAPPAPQRRGHRGAREGGV